MVDTITGNTRMPTVTIDMYALNMRNAASLGGSYSWVAS